MALRTFQSNPALGGFGGESSSSLQSGTKSGRADGDAFAQIVKELVDNAVDACGIKSRFGDRTTPTDARCPKRVRVEIQKFLEPRVVDRDENNDVAVSNDEDEILRVTVTDNGLGMSDIQACVDPFHTSKAHATNSNRDDDDDDSLKEAETAGRYGIGLTLCLLHAQRLVPGSCASIRSATADHTNWMTMKCVVDTERDSVECIPGEPIAKKDAAETGTSVSLLVKGGTSAAMAWPRLAEYFARFKLSIGMQCSLQVLAPTLARVPLYIRPPHQTNNKVHEDEDSQEIDSDKDEEELPWIDWLTSGSERHEAQRQQLDEEPEEAHVDEDRLEIWKAVQLYLGRQFNVSNVARTIVPIRVDSDAVSNNDRPQLEVSVIVHGPDEDDSMTEGSDLYENENLPETNRSAAMVLVRMVNRIPLLDSSEAAACGIVQTVAAKKRMWNSFGLDVSYGSSAPSVAKLLTFDVKDSDQVEPFFRTGNHVLLEEEDLENLEDDEEFEQLLDVDGDIDYISNLKRKRQKKLRHLLPASVRLGNILLIVEIHAQPSSLPLPTLSKGRLPCDNMAIENAIEVAITKCLRQIQSSNPSLLLSASELRTAERDARYVPAVSSALSSILCKSKSPVDSTLHTIHRWQNGSDGAVTTTTDNGGIYDNARMEGLGRLIEGRLGMILANGGKKRGRGDEQKETESEQDESLYATETVLGNLSYVSDTNSPDSLESPRLGKVLVSEDSSPHQQSPSDLTNFDDW